MGLTSVQALAAVQRLYAVLDSRRSDVDHLERYYRGAQPLAFASDQWRKVHADRYRDFADNWCGVVGNSPAERLRVSGFRLPGERTGAGPSTAEASLWSAWERNDLDEQSSQGFLSSIVAKRSFVLVWADEDGEPEITWEHPTQMVVENDPERPRRRRAALKAWIHDGTECATLYTADEVWKFERPAIGVDDTGRTRSGLHVPSGTLAAGGWMPRQPAGDDTWPLTNPMSVVPVVELPNRPMLGGEPMSDIGGTIAMQDAINLLWAYLFTAADHASMPARVIMGQEPPKIPILDENGQKIGEKPVKMEDLAHGRFLWLTGQNTSIGKWDAADLGVFTGVIEIAVGHIAAQTRTPPHYLAANKGLSNLSGDALKAAETGLVKKIEEQQLFFGPGIREVFRLVALARDDKGLAELARAGTTQWRDAESRSEAQLVDALQKLQAIGFPFAWLAERYGLSQTEVARLLEMRKDQADSDLLGTMAAQFRGAGAQEPAEPAPSAA